MADNFVTNPAAGGDTFAADDIAGVKWQRVKIGHGADGSATDVSSASPLPVDSELPAAAALDDATANPTAPMVGAAGMVWDTSTSQWVRANNARPDAGSVPTRNLPAVQPYFLHDTAAGGVSYGAQTAYKVGDGASGAQGGVSSPWNYNGASFDRQRGNTEGTLLASAARTAFTQSAAQTNYNARGVNVWVYVTAKAAATTLDLYIASFDPVSGVVTYEAKVATWAATANSGQSIQLYPGATTLAATTYGFNRIARESGALPRTWYFQIAPSDANSVTYSAGYSYIL